MTDVTPRVSNAHHETVSGFGAEWQRFDQSGLDDAEVIAATVYWPLARFALLAEKCHVNPAALPLSAYRHHSYYTMRTDALDRFGTKLEQRFTREQISDMLHSEGLTNIRFREESAFWCAIGTKPSA